MTPAGTVVNAQPQVGGASAPTARGCGLEPFCVNLHPNARPSAGSCVPLTAHRPGKQFVWGSRPLRAEDKGVRRKAKETLLHKKGRGHGAASAGTGLCLGVRHLGHPDSPHLQGLVFPSQRCHI